MLDEPALQVAQETRPRPKRGWWRLLLVLPLLLILAAVGAWFLLAPALVKAEVHKALVAAGFDTVDLPLPTLGYDRADFGAVTLGSRGAIAIQRVEVTFDPLGALRGEFETVVLHGLFVPATIRDGIVSLPSLPELDPSPKALVREFHSVEIRNGLVRADWDGQILDVPVQGTLLPLKEESGGWDVCLFKVKAKGVLPPTQLSGAMTEGPFSVEARIGRTADGSIGVEALLSSDGLMLSVPTASLRASGLQLNNIPIWWHGRQEPPRGGSFIMPDMRVEEVPLSGIHGGFRIVDGTSSGEAFMSLPGNASLKAVCTIRSFGKPVAGEVKATLSDADLAQLSAILSLHPQLAGLSLTGRMDAKGELAFVDRAISPKGSATLRSASASWPAKRVAFKGMNGAFAFGINADGNPVLKSINPATASSGQFEKWRIDSILLDCLMERTATGFQMRGELAGQLPETVVGKGRVRGKIRAPFEATLPDTGDESLSLSLNLQDGTVAVPHLDIRAEGVTLRDVPVRQNAAAAVGNGALQIAMCHVQGYTMRNLNGTLRMNDGKAEFSMRLPLSRDAVGGVQGIANFSNPTPRIEAQVDIPGLRVPDSAILKSLLAFPKRYHVDGVNALKANLLYDPANTEQPIQITGTANGTGMTFVDRETGVAMTGIDGTIKFQGDMESMKAEFSNLSASRLLKAPLSAKDIRGQGSASFTSLWPLKSITADARLAASGSYLLRPEEGVMLSGRFQTAVQADRTARGKDDLSLSLSLLDSSFIWKRWGLTIRGIEVRGIPYTNGAPTEREGRCTIPAQFWLGVPVPAISGTLRQEPAGWTANLDCPFPGTEPTAIRAGLVLEPMGALKRLYSVVRVPPFQLATAKWLPTLMPSLRGYSLAGKASLVHTTEWKEGRWTQSALLNLTDGILESEQWRFRFDGVDGVLRLTGAENLASEPKQRLRIKRARFGELDLTDGVIDYSLPNPEAVKIDACTWQWGAGQLLLQPCTLRLGGKENRLRVQFENVSLSNATALLPPDIVAGTGRLNGEVEFVLDLSETTSVKIAGGELRATPPGGILKIFAAESLRGPIEQYVKGQSIEASVRRQIAERILAALKDMRYDALRVAVRPDGNSGPLVRLQFRGRGNQAKDPIEFADLTLNLNIEGLDRSLGDGILYKRQSTKSQSRVGREIDEFFKTQTQ